MDTSVADLNTNQIESRHYQCSLPDLPGIESSQVT